MDVRIATILLGAALLVSPVGAEEKRRTIDESHPGYTFYRQYCASCHGLDGRGDTPLGKLFQREPPDLTRIAARRGIWYPEALVQEIIDGRYAAHGSREMPVWGAILTSGEISQVAEYLNTIQQMAVAP